MKLRHVPELIKAHGYIPETHHIWTEDDYCLNVHRIPSPNRVPIKTDSITNTDTVINNICEDSNLSSSSDCHHDVLKTLRSSNANSKLPILVNHGLLSSSADWVLLGPHKALAYVLCDNGFDVWLANARGNTYSKSHKHYSTKDKEFWDFSFHEIGYYDLPAMIDYILKKTGYSELYYIGHSQGTTTFYIMLSERPEYNSKIKGMISLAPIAFISNQTSPLIKYVVHFIDLLQWSSNFFNFYEWLPYNKLQATLFSTLVRNAPCSVTKGICHYWFFLVAGFGSDQLDESMLPLIFGHFPAGGAMRQFIHFGQLVMSGHFRQFDYGAKMNLNRYGSIQPLKYNLERIKVPIAIFYSDNDHLTHDTDIQKLVNKLPNVIEVKKIPYEKFNHIDYLWGRDAKTLLYNQIIMMLKKF
ncbi:lipase 3 isoform X2 [Anoplolepis gracilipes]|uniref:lipase 3 isoform X2 n=1 Tax=Anoplolepis gracilipes TaxID=354296 RepID=UPI003BA3CC1E